MAVQLLNKTNELTKSSSGLLGISERAASASSDLLRKTSTAAASSEQISANITTVSSSAEEMTASVIEISKSTSNALHISEEAKEKANLANNVVNSLGASSSEIGASII